MGLATVIIKKDGLVEPTGHVVEAKPPNSAKNQVNCSLFNCVFSLYAQTTKFWWNIKMYNKRALMAVVATMGVLALAGLSIFPQQSDDDSLDIGFFAWLDSRE